MMNIFKNCTRQLVKFAKKHDISVPAAKKKRKVSCHVDDTANNLQESKCEEMKICLFCPLLDTMVTELNQRFKQETLNVITAIGNLLNFDITKDQQKILSETFAVSLDELEAEVRLLRSNGSVPKGSTSSVTSIKEWLNRLNLCDITRTFNSFTKVIQNFTVVPTTSCSCERAFSKLSHAKSELHSTMTQDHLQTVSSIGQCQHCN
jgi:hypothetical protein